ncbi:PPC domain-containing protein [Thermocoleostomius sinensis]|jgi:hypothetical protein|uniref:PPC domain-containing protein n=1 Tax=Thermocoleostomius sinensis A174 TaxID=2016057 RepID=A0A9E8ZAE1_9CYAN|nr:PPC domain-containing protein [Thermocoleostomius sinensis]WAL58242.1 PPC domain-containing protein [Thermocoleostomius sinensis A174]
MAEFELGLFPSGRTRSFNNFVGNVDPEDTFRFFLTGSNNYINAALTGMSQDADLYLYRDVNNNGIIDFRDQLVSQSSAGGNADDAINVRVSLPGSYIAQVRRFGSSNTNYRLSLSNFNPSNLLPVEADAGVLRAAPYVRNDSVGTNDTADVTRFTMGSVGNYNASLTNITAGTDVDMRLIRDVDGDRVLTGRDVVIASSTRGSNLDEAINVRNLAAGTYFLQTYLFSGNNANYTLRMSNGGFRPGNLLTNDVNAGTLSSTPFTQTNFVSTNDSENLYRFTMGSAGNFNASLTGISGGDVDMRLIRDSNNNGIVDVGDEVVRSQAGSTNDEAINVRNLAAGTYFLQTYLFSGNNVNYTLKMSNTGSSGFSPSNLLPTETNVGVLTGTTTHFDSVSTNDAADTFRFGVSSSRTVNLSLTGLQADADLRLIRDINNNGVVDSGEVISTSLAGGTSSEQISAFLSPGNNYFAQVYLFPSTGSTPYTLSIS